MGAYADLVQAQLNDDLLARRRAATAAAPVETKPTAYPTATLTEATPVPEAGYLAGTAASLIRGVAQIPVMGGHALEANPEADVAGVPLAQRSFRNRAGSVIAGIAERARDAIDAPNYGKNELKRSVFGGVESLPGSLAYVAPSVAGAVIGQTLMPIPGAGAIAGAAAGSAATYPIMQKSTYQDTYEALKKEQAAGRLKPGTTEQQIVDAATKAGHYEAAPEAATNLGEALLYTSPGAGAAAKVGRRLLSKATGKQLAKNYAGSLAMEVPSEMVTAAGQQEAVNSVTTAPETTPMQAAIESIGPTAVMTGLMAGGGTIGQHLKQRLDGLAAKIETDATGKEVLKAAGPTPRAAALIAGVPATDASQIALPAGMPDLLGGASQQASNAAALGTIAPKDGVIDLTELAPTVVDSENFTSKQAADLLARRKEAEARNAAAFDTANPAIPKAPESAYVPQVIPELGPPPATGGNIDLGLPATPKEKIIDLTEIAPDAQTGVSPVTGADYSQLTADESNKLFMERYAADPDGWTRAINTAAAANRDAGISDAHANRVAALALHDKLVAEREAAQPALAPPPEFQPAAPTSVHGNFSVHEDVFDNSFSIRDDRTGTFVEHGATSQAAAQQSAQEYDAMNFNAAGLADANNATQEGGDPNGQVQGRGQEEVATPLLQDPTTGAPVSFGSEPALGNPSGRTAEQINQDLNASVVNPHNQAQLLADHVEYTNLTGQTHPLLDNHSRDLAAPAPVPWYEDTTPPTADDLARLGQHLTNNADETNRVRDEVRAEALAMPQATRPTPGMVNRETANRMDAQAVVTSQVAQTVPTNFTPDQYDTMNYGELNVEFNTREQQNAPLANSCYAYAWDNTSPSATQADRIRAALVEYDFRSANPAATNPQNVVPTWADNNDALLPAEETRRTQLRDSRIQTYQDLYNEVGAELVNAGINPARQENALFREMLRRFNEYSSQDVQGTPYLTRRQPDGTYWAISVAANSTDVGRGFATRADAEDYARLMVAPATPVPGTAAPAAPDHMAFENSSVFRVASGIFNASYNGGTATPTRDAVRLVMANPSLSIAESSEIAMRPIADVMAAEVDFNVMAALRDMIDAGYASIADALHYVNEQERTAYEAANAPPRVPASGAAAIARIGDFTAPADFIAYLYGDAFNDSTISGVNLRQYADDMYRTDIQQRIDRVSGWPTSTERERVLSVLTDIRGMGYATLRDAHVGAAPSVVVTAPQNVAVPEVRAAILAPTTPEETVRGDEMVAKALNLVRGAMNGAPTTGNEVAKAWHSAFKKIWKAVAGNIEEYRYGAVPASVNTIQGVVDTINTYAIQKGRNIRLKVTGSYLTATTVPRGTHFTIQTSNDGGTTWGVAMTTSSTTSTGSTNAMNTRDRGAGDAGLGYYAMHVIARNVTGATFQSSGMTTVNQLRRVEHAFNELARHGGAARAIGVAANINEFGSGNTHGYHELTRGAVNALTAVSARSYAKIIKLYPQLGRYKFDFATGTVIHIESGLTVPVEFITGHVRTGRSLNDPIFRVAQSGNVLEGFSDSVINRALITQEVIRTENREGKPNAAQITRFANAVRDAAAYNQPILYNRTGATTAQTTMQADTLAKGLRELTAALDGVLPINIIQSQDHFPGWHAGMPAFNAAYHNGAIYVVADQVSSVAEAKRLVLDHELRHAGLRQVLGKGMDTFLKQAWYAKTDEIKGFANAKGIDTSSTEGRLEAAEEFVVSLAQEAKSHPLLDRAIAKIRQLLRAIGFDLNLSRSELRAMVSQASMLKESATQDGTTRFARTGAAQLQPQAQAPVDHTVAGFYRNARDKFKSMRAAARGAEWVTQMAMPIDRLIDLALLNSVYKPIKALLPIYTRLQREMQNIQDQIVGDAGRRFEHFTDVCKTQAEKDNFNSIMRDGTLWGLYPEGGKVTWTNDEWNAEMAEKTGMTLSEAFADLNGRYRSMTEAQRTQYHAAINDMEKLRKRYQKSMQDFVKKITVETTLDNATMTDNTLSLKSAEGKNYYLKQNDQGMWELRQADNRVTRVEMEKAVAAEGFLPQGKREKLLGQVDAKFNNIKGPYAPLSRFGNIVVNVFEPTTDPPGEVSEDRTARYHFEKESDAQELMTRMRAEGFKVTIEEAAQSKSMRAQVPSEFVTELNAAIERMADGLNPVDDAEQVANIKGFGAQIQEDMSRIWLSMTPESSALKHTMKRTGLAGFNEDMMRGYVGYAQRHARGIAYLDRGVAIRENIKTMRENIAAATDNSEDARASKRFVDHLENHEATVRGEKLSDLTQTLTRFPFLWYLSSPSVFLVQSAQPFIMTLPKLAVKFGYGKSLAAITKAYAKQSNLKDQPFSNKRLEAYEQTAEIYVNRQFEGLETASLFQGLNHEESTLLGLAIAVKRGAIDITMTHEAMNILKGNVKGIGDKVTEKAAFLMQLSELMSRKAAFVATYDMEMERHGDATKAIENAIKVVDDTLYNYSRANRPGFMLGNAGRILFQFQIFRVHTLSKMLQLLVTAATGENKTAAIKEFSMMMGNTMLAAGVTGLPFLSTVMGAFAFVFGSDDEPWDFDVYMRSLVGDGVVGDALLKGAPTLFGMDVSRRIGMGSITDMFAGDPPAGVKGAQLYSYYAGKALGPLGGVTSDVLFKAPEMVKQGMWTELLEQTTPKPVKDLMTGYNTMFGEGKYTGKGKLLVDSADMTIWDSVLAMGGVNPTKISNAQEQNYNAQKLSAEINDRRGTLQKQLQRAVMSQDPDKIDTATDAIAKFNGRMPQFAITKQQIASGVKRALRKEMGLEDKNITKVRQKYGIGEGA